MRKPNALVYIAIVAVFALLGILTGIATSRTTTISVRAQEPDATIPQKLHTLYGLQFRPSDTLQIQSPINEQEALEAAVKQMPGLAKAKSYSGMVGTLTDPTALQARADGIPLPQSKADFGNVWVIVFDGIETVSSGPPEAPRRTSSQMGVVINATTGMFIMSFTL